jgi:hypothetical protein
MTIDCKSVAKIWIYLTTCVQILSVLLENIQEFIIEGQ